MCGNVLNLCQIHTETNEGFEIRDGVQITCKARERSLEGNAGGIVNPHRLEKQLVACLDVSILNPETHPMHVALDYKRR